MPDLELDRRLDSLDAVFRSKVYELLARATEAGLLLVIVNTRRDNIQQAILRDAGRSWVKRSKHEQGLAIDVALSDVFQAKGPDKLAWNMDDRAVLDRWILLGEIGEKIGLRWGGRWDVADLGHFEVR